MFPFPGPFLSILQMDQDLAEVVFSLYSKSLGFCCMSHQYQSVPWDFCSFLLLVTMSVVPFSRGQVLVPRGARK